MYLWSVRQGERVDLRAGVSGVYRHDLLILDNLFYVWTAQVNLQADALADECGRQVALGHVEFSRFDKEQLSGLTHSCQVLQ